MKKITSFSDIQYIIQCRCDVFNPKGEKVQFVRFLNMTLMQIILLVDEGGWTYDPTY